jgi:hypothetical protein
VTGVFSPDRITGICSMRQVGNRSPAGRRAGEYALGRLRDLYLELLAESVGCGLQGE